MQHGGTEVGIANQPVELGVPKQDVVLAFHEPAVCQLTGFGTGKIDTVEHEKIEV
ncbi:element excision factor XisI family protein [Leptolyngbya sp. NK1-12]|uniref:element excision factor XisI family protein n=1 Tax=Leptolyngbya sp. NK1-12 TaxID=2547451 RepID=UPI00292DC646